MAFVLDSSVTLAWVLPDEQQDASDALLDRLLAASAWAPVIWPFEVANALLVSERRGRLRATDRKALINALAALPIDIDHDGVGEAFGVVLTLASQHGLTSYDASYLELAQRRALPLATLDERLRRASQQLGIAVLP